MASELESLLPRLAEEQISRAREIADILRTSILNGVLPPNSMQSVGDLSQALGVSRTPVREALIQLASRGLVKFERNRGVRILQTSDGDLRDIFEIRRFLEAPAVANAAIRASAQAIEELREILRQQDLAESSGDEAREWELDRQFHRRLLLESGNRRLADYLDQLRDAVLIRRATTVGMAQHIEGVGKDHFRILDAVVARDPELARQETLRHLDRTLAMVLPGVPADDSASAETRANASAHPA